MKIAIATIAVVIALPLLLGGIGQAIVKGLFGNSSTQPSMEALADIPGDYLALYQAAAPICPGLHWSEVEQASGVLRKLRASRDLADGRELLPLTVSTTGAS